MTRFFSCSDILSLDPWCPYGKGMALRGGDSGPGIREDARGEDSIMTVLLRFHDYFRTALRYFHV